MCVPQRLWEVSIGYWEPVFLVDVTRHPFCMVNLGGVQLHLGLDYGSGEVGAKSTGEGGSFYYAHWYVFPLMYWLNILMNAGCVQHGDFNIAHLAEPDPTWRDDELNCIINPEAALFSNPIAQTTCAADSIKSNTGLPSDFFILVCSVTRVNASTRRLCTGTHWGSASEHTVSRAHGLQNAPRSIGV